MIKDSIVLSASTMVVAVIGFITQIILTQNMTLEGYGTFKLVFSILATLSIFSLPSFNTLVTKASSQGYQRFFITANLWCFGISLIGSAIILVLSSTTHSQLAPELRFAALLFPFYSGINIAQAQLLGLKKFKSAALLAISISASLAVGQIFILRVPNSTITSLVLVTLSLQSFINLVATIWLSINASKCKRDSDQERSLILFGSKLTALSIVSIISSQLQYILLGWFVGPATVAIYSVAQIFPDKIKPMFKALLSPYSVTLASNTNQVSLQIVKKSLGLLCILGIIMTVGALLILPMLIEFGFGERYRDSIHITQALSLGLITLPFTSIIGSVMVYHDDEASYRKVTLIRDGLMLIGYLIFVPLFSMLGIVLVQLSVITIHTLMYIHWVLKNATVMPHTISLTPDKRYDGHISTNFTGYNAIQIIRATTLVSSNPPVWMRILAPCCFTNITNPQTVRN